jgi:hypothetical protein
MLNGYHFAADRRPLYMGVEDRQEDADARQRRCGQSEFGRRQRILDETDEAVRRRDDQAGPGGRHPRRMPEKRRVGRGRSQTDPSQPRAFMPERGERQAGADERQPCGVHRRNRGAHQRREPLGTGFEIGASGHRAAILRAGTFADRA